MTQSSSCKRVSTTGSIMREKKKKTRRQRERGDVRTSSSSRGRGGREDLEEGERISKRYATEAKETEYRGKRDLVQRQKRPSTEAKETSRRYATDVRRPLRQAIINGVINAVLGLALAASWSMSGYLIVYNSCMPGSSASCSRRTLR